MKDITDRENPALEKCLGFLEQIGIKTVFNKLDPGSFLPGLLIEDGCIIIDRDSLKYPGDILHEAGHLAVVPASERVSLDANSIAKRADREAEEMMAIAWSFAACVFLEIDPGFVFHAEGYKGGGNQIAQNFLNKQYFGLPMLQWVGMTADAKNASRLNVPPYPHMIKWLRD